MCVFCVCVGVAGWFGDVWIFACLLDLLIDRLFLCVFVCACVRVCDFVRACACLCALSRLVQIEHLDISHCRINGIGMSLIAEGVRKNKTLKSITLDGNNIQQAGARALYKASAARQVQPCMCMYVRVCICACVSGERACFLVRHSIHCSADIYLHTCVCVCVLMRVHSCNEGVFVCQILDTSFSSPSVTCLFVGL